MDRAVEPTLAALASRGIDYRGVLYAGLMLTAEGPKVLEFNVRFGDPETQVVLPRTLGDLAGLLAEAADGRLRSEPAFCSDAAATVVCCARNYPVAPYGTGEPISGLDEAASVPGVVVFHAGTALDGQGRLVTAGGRVLDVTALAPSLGEARARAYDAVGRLRWPGIQYRKDIAEAASAREVA
jgi:phosphoribosylamine--glycine ligase